MLTDGGAESAIVTPRPHGSQKAANSLPADVVTFAFTDIEGSTVRWEAKRAAMQEAVRRHDAILRAAIAEHGGRVFKTIGDAFCSAFARPKDAVAAMLAAQRALAAEDFSTVDGLRVRAAIHTGTADAREDDYFGPALNKVARLLSIGHGGQTLLSSTSAELVHDNLPPEVTLTDLGEHTLRDFKGLERVHQLVAPHLRRNFPELRSHEALQPWLIPDAMRTRYFTGRDDLLEQLHAQLMERRVAALSGLGGIGKTQTAIEYAVRHRADYPAGVFWINAETIGGLTGGFAEIAKTLRLRAAESNDQEQAAKAALAWLNRNDGWLLIFDNVDDRRDLRNFAPARGKGNVLITSRESVFAEFGVPRAFDVPELAGDEAARFLLARTGHDVAPNECTAAVELAAELGNLPLALEQAAAYIAETDASFAAYLATFRKRRMTLLEKAIGMITHDTVAVTWAANFEAVERLSSAAVDVMRVSALLAPDAIPFELFLQGSQALGEPIAEALDDADDMAMLEILRPLTRYSLVRSDTESRTFSVHRLVQEIAWMAVAEFERRMYIERTVLALDAAFPDVAFANWGRCERLIPHVASVAGRIGTLDVQPEISGRLLNRAGRYLQERGRYAEARELHEHALVIAERAFGPEHPNVAQSLNALAVAYWFAGRYAEAKELSRRGLAIRERVVGSDHLEVAESLTTLGVVYVSMGRFPEARSQLERALAIREQTLGPDHPSLVRSLINVANLHADTGVYGHARLLTERALRISEAALGPDHPDLAATLTSLSDRYRDLGRYADAEALDKRALAIREQALGLDHPDVAFSLQNLAEGYMRVGRYAEAERIYERALELRERAFGRDHPGVVESLNGLANVCVAQGRYAEAEPLYMRALETREHALGPDHPYVAKILIGLAALRKNQGRDADAIALYERAIAIMDRSHRSHTAEVATSLDDLAELYGRQGRHEDAASLLARTKAIREQTLARGNDR
jgi:class 3 adenylate cyclase/tetratricopeptide (TPR) repeat protein